MRKLLANKLYLMLISVLIAFVMWVSVVSISNPDTTGSKAVTVEERNASAITSEGKAYTVLGSKTVKVNYTVQARDAYKVKSSDFRAYIDLSDIYDATGNVRVVVQTVNNQDIINDCSCSPQTLQVVVEDIITKTVNVKVYTVDRCPDGYEAAASSTTLTQVDIKGPESLINSIAVAGVEVSVKDAVNTLSGNADLKFYDSDAVDAKVVDVSNNKYFSASAYSTDYTLFITTAKDVPIQYEVSGSAASGYHYAGSTASIDSVMVKGNADVLGQISVITIPSSALNINGATSDKSWNIDLSQYLPTGASISETHQIEITAHIEADSASVHGGPGVTHTEAETTASHTESSSASQTAESSGASTSAGGPGVDQTQSGTVEEKQSETQAETTEHARTQEHTQVQKESQTQEESEAQSESQSHENSDAVTESQSHENSETRSESQSHEQGSDETESQSHENSETQAQDSQHEQTETSAESLQN